MEDMMNESGYGPRTRRRAAIAIAALLGCILAVLPMGPAHAAPVQGLTLTSPTFEEDFTRGQTVTITWATNFPAGTLLTIVLMQSDGTTPVQTIADNVPVKPNAYKWTVPMTAGALAIGSYKISVTTKVPAAIKVDASDDAFNVTDGVITATSPKATDNWKLGDTGRSVKWDPGTATGPIVVDLLSTSNVKLATVKTTVAATAKSFSWDIPVGIVTATGTYKLRYSSIANAAVTGMSANFTLTLPTIAVTFPDTAVNWDVGSAQTIKWTSQAPGTVKIQLADASGTPVGSPLKTGVPAKSGSFVYTLPANTTVGSGTNKILITSEQNPNVFDASNVAFNTTTPVVTVTNPSGSTLSMGDNVKIKWTTSVAGKVQIDLLDASNGVVKTLSPPAGVLTTSATAASTFNWDIPLNIASSSGIFKIKVTTLTTPAFTTSASFTLNMPTVTIVSVPDTSWDAGTLHTITWSTSPSTINTSVKLDLYDNTGPALFRTIKTVPVRPGTLAYLVPYDVPFGTYFLRITSVGATGNALITDDSATFILGAPTIAVTQPGNVTVGATVPLSFSTDMSGTVKLQLVSGTSVISTFKASLASTATSFSWAMPVGIVTASGTYKIRLASNQSTGASFYGESLGFTITVPTLTVGATGSGTWATPSSQTVTWSGFSTGSVKITLFNNATPGTIITLKSTVVASLGTSAVAVPDVAAGSYTLTVTSLLNPAITGTLALTLT